jgi:hypothetical protein
MNFISSKNTTANVMTETTHNTPAVIRKIILMNWI